MHLVNHTSALIWRQPTEEFIPVGPLKIAIKLPEDVTGKIHQLLVSKQDISAEIKDGWVSFTILSITDHEVVVVT